MSKTSDDRGDRYENFKQNVGVQNEYRDAYAALSARDPQAAMRMPHPDSNDHDFAESLAAIKQMNAGVKADPSLDIKA